MELNIKVSSVSELSGLLPLVQNDSANKKLDLIMSKLTDLLAKDQELVKDVNTLLDVNTQQNALISQLNDTIKNSSMSDEDKAAVDSIMNDLTALDTKVKAVITPPTT